MREREKRREKREEKDKKATSEFTKIKSAFRF